MSSLFGRCLCPLFFGECVPSFFERDKKDVCVCVSLFWEEGGCASSFACAPMDSTIIQSLLCLKSATVISDICTNQVCLSFFCGSVCPLFFCWCVCASFFFCVCVTLFFCVPFFGVCVCLFSGCVCVCLFFGCVCASCVCVKKYLFCLSVHINSFLNVKARSPDKFMNVSDVKVSDQDGYMTRNLTISTNCKIVNVRIRINSFISKIVFQPLHSDTDARLHKERIIPVQEEPNFHIVFYQRDVPDGMRTPWKLPFDVVSKSFPAV